MEHFETQKEESVSIGKRNIRDKAVIHCINALICIVLTAALSFSFSFFMTHIVIQ